MSPQEPTVGWICALSVELTAARLMLDVCHTVTSPDVQDHNVYIGGQIHGHQVVIACLPEYGPGAAASVARDMFRSFPSIRFLLMVGTGGGVPSAKNDIRLGDVVVSMPQGQHGGVISYDLQKLHPAGSYRKGHMDKPPPILRTAVQTLRSTYEIRGVNIGDVIENALTENSELREEYGRPPFESDKLYENECAHRETRDLCEVCVEFREVEREPRVDLDGTPTDGPEIFYGLIGSGEKVVASIKERDLICANDNILCLEMEACGLMNTSPCLVIRGISNYADAHKCDDWQPYASMTAAAYAKDLLKTVPVPMAKKLEQVNVAFEEEYAHSSLRPVKELEDSPLPFLQFARAQKRKASA